MADTNILYGNAEADARREKTLKEARRTVKYGPYFTPVFSVMLGVELWRLAGHWRVGSALGLLSTVGFLLCCVCKWQQARFALRGEHQSPYDALLLMGFLLAGSGRCLADMYHYKQMSVFQVLAMAVSVICVFCLGLAVWEVRDLRRRRRRTAAGEAKP